MWPAMQLPEKTLEERAVHLQPSTLQVMQHGQHSGPGTLQHGIRLHHAVVVSNAELPPLFCCCSRASCPQKNVANTPFPDPTYLESPASNPDPAHKAITFVLRMLDWVKIPGHW